MCEDTIMPSPKRWTLVIDGPQGPFTEAETMLIETLRDMGCTVADCRAVTPYPEEGMSMSDGRAPSLADLRRLEPLPPRRSPGFPMREAL